MPETIPPELFGKDHWSTFAYIETRCVDHDGWIDARHMRGHMDGWERYPTRCRGTNGVTIEIQNHNDYHCADDLVAAGLLESFGRGTKRDASGKILRLTHRAVLTPLGEIVAGKLRAHKSEGGNFHEFDPGPTAGWWAVPQKMGTPS